ncbi:MAG: glycosyltransferase N-terminal domain-containing protein [Myxococcota bacterium]|nr:glycosyltransferase N-terminal domain-containing protein [Myxococcota bacterium]
MGAARRAGAALTAMAGAPVAVAALVARPRLRRGLSERLGAWPRMAPGSVWVHASAVGEIRAASRLVDRLRKQGYPVCTSTWTLPGRAAMRDWRPEVACHLAPVDHPWCVEAALARVAPAVLVLVETELWPSWIAAARRRDIPVVIVSGRLSDRSFPRYQRFSRLLGRTLRRLRAVGARSELDAERFRELGTPADRVTVTGDLKLDLAQGAPEPAGDLEALLRGTRFWVAGSTHAGEESPVAEAFEAVLRAGHPHALVVAPRHPPRTAEVERLLRRRGHRVRRRSRAGEGSLEPGEILLLDTVGELASVYGRAEAAFVGGSLVPIGGHNVLEPAHAGRPVLYGPHTDNIGQPVEILEAAGGGFRVDDAPALGAALAALLADPEVARLRGEAGRRAVAEHRGSVERSLALIEAALADRVG